MKTVYALCFLAVGMLSGAGSSHAKNHDKTSMKTPDKTAAVVIAGIDHIGINVPDIEAATRFLEQAFGAAVIYESYRKTQPPLDLSGIENTLNVAPHTSIHAARLIRIGYGPTIELFEVHAADQRNAARSSDLGLQHFALYTDNMAEAIARFVAAGGRILSEPNAVLFPEEKGARNFFCYGVTPWGTSVEFITYPEGMPYEAQTPLRRWKPQIKAE